MNSDAPVETRRLTVTVVRSPSDPDHGYVMQVDCPKRGFPVDVIDCTSCERCIGMSIREPGGTSFLVCKGPFTETKLESPELPRSDRPRSPAGATPVSAIMSSPVLTIHPEMGVEAMLRLFLDKGISGAPVVEDDGCPVGLVSKTDLLRLAKVGAGIGDRALCMECADLDLNSLSAAGWQGVTARDIMMPFLFSLPEESTIAQAAALMSFEAIHRVPIVRDGAVVGLVSSTDVLRWVAENDGYVVPHRPDRTQ